MSKPYWSGPGPGAGSRFADDPPTGGNNYGYGGEDAHRPYSDDYDPPTEDLGIYQDYDDYRPDTRWRWIAALAAVVLMSALVGIAFASRGGDSSTSATPAPSAPPEQDAITATTPRTVIATLPPAAPTAELPPETVVTVTPSPSPSAEVEAEAPPPPAEAAPPPAVAATPPASTITYTVTGTRQLFDLVTIIYTDEQGFPRTDVNVALPWHRTVVLNPGVETKSVTATSLTGQLNCTVTDGAGAVLAAQANNAAIATCTP